MGITFCILQDETCTNPKETECKEVCYFGQNSDGDIYKGCTEGAEAAQVIALMELNDNEKRCKTVKDWDNLPRTTCLCNYDLCNENMDNMTSPTTKLGVVPAPDQEGSRADDVDVTGGETLAPPAPDQEDAPAPNVTYADMKKFMVSSRKVYW